MILGEFLGKTVTESPSLSSWFQADSRHSEIHGTTVALLYRGRKTMDFFLFFFSVCLSFFLFQNLVNGFFSLSLYVKVSCRGFDVRFSSILLPSLFLTVPLSLPLFLSFSFPLSLPLPSSLSRSPALPETCASVLVLSFLPSFLPSVSLQLSSCFLCEWASPPQSSTYAADNKQQRVSSQTPATRPTPLLLPPRASTVSSSSGAPPVPPHDSSTAWAQGLVDCSYVSNYLCLGPPLPTKEKRNFLSEPCPLHVLPVTREPACRLHTRHFQAPILNQFRLALPREEETAH